MNVGHVKRSSTKFYQEDIVRSIAEPTIYGIVLRCWHDAEDLPPPNQLMDPLMRPLEPGEVGISFFPAGNRDIRLEADFELVDRNFQPGDLCKRSIDDVRSGVVVGTEVKGLLQHVISGAPVDGWKTSDDLENRGDIETGDYVVYDDWIGQVVELYDEAIVEISTGQLVRLPELSSRLSVGDKGSDILPSPVGVQSLFGFFLGTHRPSNVDTVVAVKHTVMAICWLALNQSLDPREASIRSRPKRLWHGLDLSKLTVIRGKSDKDMRVGDKVQFKDPTGLPSTTHGGPPNDVSDFIEVQTFVVKETRTTVAVLWQDCSLETLKSSELIPYLNPDEYDCWPGDHVLWKSEGEKRAAIIQSVNATERTASIRFSDTGAVELVSVLELDPHGTSDWSAAAPHALSDGLGVRRADFVFIHREGTTNGLERPRVPKLGELEVWVRELPVSSDGTLAGWRRQMTEIGADIATRRGHEEIPEGQMKHVVKGDHSFHWFGEVTALRLDGCVEVTHPDGTVEACPLERLTKLTDGMEQLEDDLWGDEGSEGHTPYHEDAEEIWSKDDNGVWRLKTEDDTDEWEETDDDGDDEDIVMDHETESMPSEVPVPIQESPPMEDSNNIPLVSPNSKKSSPSPANGTLPDHGDPDSDGDNKNKDEGSDDSGPWKRFDVLPSAPQDHAFYASVPTQPSKSFLARLRREYKVLSSSLPDSIIVRAYEDRADLLRSLIIGPENTPYEDAPFVIDWMLDSNFPHSPPIAHFLSWTNGNGRVNPNLYEEGKVCLSILGTWAGDQNEMWSSARSSLLQALVSIQGLVLVKEPWFCEPAYEKLRGTEEGVVNSRLYSEKAYVLSRGFVRRALEIPLGGLEFEVNWLYYTSGRLDKVVHDARALIEKSQKPENSDVDKDNDRAISRLTAGGIIALGRTLSKLQSLLDSQNPTA